MNYKEIIQEVSINLNLPYEVVDKAYTSYWEFVRKMIHVLPLKKDLSEQEFNQLRTSFNVPSLGKLNCQYNKLLGIKYSYKRRKQN